MTNPPPVAPVEGHYARLRNGMVVGPLAKEWPQDELTSFSIAWEHLEWKQDGTGHGMLPAWDIIATISPADMQAAASGELERLRAALDDIFEMWAGSEGFIPHTAPEGYLLMLVKKMADRAALAKQGDAP